MLYVLCSCSQAVESAQYDLARQLQQWLNADTVSLSTVSLGIKFVAYL